MLRCALRSMDRANVCRQWATGQMSVAGIGYAIHEDRTRAKYEMQQAVLILWAQLNKRVGSYRQMRARASSVRLWQRLDAYLTPQSSCKVLSTKRSDLPGG